MLTAKSLCRRPLADVQAYRVRRVARAAELLRELMQANRTDGYYGTEHDHERIAEALIEQIDAGKL